MPNLYIIAGPNGAGKTTSANKILPQILLKRIEFVNADNIAKGISPYNPEDVAFQAGRIMLNRIEELINYRSDFAFETTLSTLSYKKLITECKDKGYEVSLVYIWLNSPELAVERVKQRVSNGGHNIPKNVIIRRYRKGINNLRKIFLNLCDNWLIVDNSTHRIRPIARSLKGDILKFDADKFELITHDKKRNRKSI